MGIFGITYQAHAIPDPMARIMEFFEKSGSEWLGSEPLAPGISRVNASLSQLHVFYMLNLRNHDILYIVGLKEDKARDEYETRHKLDASESKEVQTMLILGEH